MDNSGFPQLQKTGGERKKAQLPDRGTKWEVVSVVPVHWEIITGELDPTELAAGNINGLGGNVALGQRFSEGLTPGDYQVQVGRQASQTQSITLTALKFASSFQAGQSAQVVWTKNGVASTSSIISIKPGDEVSFNPSIELIYGIKINTDADARTITDISIFKGEISGGTVEVTGNSIKKINGAEGFNSGASSTQSIPNGENGYFQFQYAGGEIRIGTTYTDTTYSENEEPTQHQIQFTGIPGIEIETVSGNGFTTDLVGREIRAIIDTPGRNLTAGEISTITEIPSNTIHAKHSAGDGTGLLLFSQQGYNWELLKPRLKITGANYDSGPEFITNGDFFRIRHYSTSNQLKFQKRQDVYAPTTFDNASLAKNDGTDHIFSIPDRPFVRALASLSNLVEGRIYRLHKVSTTTLRGTIHELNGTEVTTTNAAGKWEVVSVVGQDYITFFTPSLLNTNGYLFLFVSLSLLTSHIYDAIIATLYTF